MPNPTAAMLTIGDEILSGRTRDTNMPHLAAALTGKGIALREARTIPDEMAAIVAAVNELRARYTHVFTSGGIGPTHDDITADAVAAAFGVPIDVREDARAILASHYADPARHVQCVQLELAQRTYMDEDTFEYDDAKALRLRPVLERLLRAAIAG